MQAQIDQLTGGLVFVDTQAQEENLENMIESMKKKTQSLNTDRVDINALYNPQPSRLSLDEKYKLAISVGEECIQPAELRTLLETKTHPICYDGFEPSGRMHIAQGVLKAINVNKLVDAGCIFYFWVADWFALLNNKMGGDLNKIRIVEVWRALGMKMQNVKFLWASDEINKRSSEYWLMVMDIARKNTIPRIKRCATIMGRNEEEDLAVAQCLYPCMQCTDIFFLKADICQLGMDQRKVNMLAREYCDDIKRKQKPVILSHHMLSGLKEGQEKMSKSDPESAIFMEDTEADIKTKIKKAYCPPGVTKGNPCADYVKNIIFGANSSFEIKRKPADGGDKVYKDYETFEKDYLAEKIHPGDLKPAIAEALNNLIKPVRDHFENDPRAKQILTQVRSFQVTR